MGRNRKNDALKWLRLNDLTPGMGLRWGVKPYKGSDAISILIKSRGARSRSGSGWSLAPTSQLAKYTRTSFKIYLMHTVKLGPS